MLQQEGERDSRKYHHQTAGSESDPGFKLQTLSTVQPGLVTGNRQEDGGRVGVYRWRVEEDEEAWDEERKGCWDASGLDQYGMNE